MDLEWWGALLFALVCTLLGITGTALMLLLREAWWRAPHRIVERGRRRRQAQEDWDAATEAAMSLTRPDPGEGPATGRAGLYVPEPGADETVLLPVASRPHAGPVPADSWDGEGYTDGWNQPDAEPELEDEPTDAEEPEPEAGNPLFEETLAALQQVGGDATVLIQAVTSEQSVESGLADAYDVFGDDDHGESEQQPQDNSGDQDDRDDRNTGGGSAGGELEVQTAALPTIPAPVPPSAAGHRYPWPRTARPSAGWVGPQPGLAWPRFGPLMRVARWAAARGRLLTFRPIQVRRLVETWRSGELARLTGVQVRSGPIVRHRRGGGYWPVSA